jgi:dipeptidyl aminopeptidase/acylaminoacyl peptidase
LNQKSLCDISQKVTAGGKNESSKEGHIMRIIKITIFILSIIFCYPFTQGKAEEQKRAMTFLDVIQMRSLGDADISPDGKWFIYTIYVPDWEKSKWVSDIYITPLSGGKTKQMTFTKDKNENSTKWYKDSSFFAFLSNRSEDKDQIYFMRPDGGEAWQVTDDKDGVDGFQWSRDWKYLAYTAGKTEERQIWIMPGKGGDAEKLTDHKTPISSYFWNPNSKKIYFVAPDSIDLLDKERKEKKFDVVIKDEIKTPSHLWEIDTETKEKRRLTGGNEYSVLRSVISEDGTKIAFRRIPTKRYTSFTKIETYLLELNTNTISRITNNSVHEISLSFSPDSKWFAFTVADGEKEFMNLRKIYVIPSGGGEVKKLLTNFDYDGWRYFWGDDSRYIYFTSQVGVNNRLSRVLIDNDKIEQITNFDGVTSFTKDEDSGKFFISYSDPENPTDYYYSEPENFNYRDKWIKLTDLNPQVKEFLLGKYETIRWKSTDAQTIEGLLIKPVNYKKDRKYPLIVDIHGGPFSADMNSFEANVHVFATNDYAVFKPNYRGSSGYGEKFEKEIAGDYFRLSFDDIMTGVDYLIERGIVHPDSMGIMGWSAGGMLSNWALVSTDRFKAISTGAGAVNWISYYAQAGLQTDLTEFYFKGTPYNNWDHYVKESPLKYIKNAKTPTLIHFGEYDRRVSISQGQELYMALKKLGVPTEFIVYPNTGHGIRNMRYQMVKMQAEFNWFEKWIRGKKGWIDWKDMIETLKMEEK